MNMDGAREKGIALQERDIAVLRGLYESRLMTTGHVTVLYFDGKLDAARKRLQKLKAGGLLRDRPRDHSEPAVLQLSKKGFDCLKSHHRLEGFSVITDREFESRSRVSSLTLRHELECVAVKAAFVAAFSRLPDIHKLECTTWPRLAQFTVRQPSAGGYGGSMVLVKPDGFLHIQQSDNQGMVEHSCFIEVDRGTESQALVADKAVGYRDHYRSGGFAESRGGHRHDCEQFPFRVLAVFKTAERRNNAAERLLIIDPPIKTMVWLTTMPEMLGNPLGSIWVRPVDFQEAIAGTSFEIFARRQFGKYQRQIERDAVLEAAIKKHKVLEL